MFHMNGLVQPWKNAKLLFRFAAAALPIWEEKLMYDMGQCFRFAQMYCSHAGDTMQTLYILEINTMWSRSLLDK